MEEEISLIEIFQILKKRLFMIMGLSFLGFIITFVFTFFVVTPKYSATTQLLVNRSQATEIIQQSDINTNLELIETYKDIIKGPVILDDVREALDLDLSHEQLSAKINILTETRSQVFSMEVVDANPYEAATIANTTAETFQENINEIMNVDNVQIISEAKVNTDPISPNKTLNLTIGVLLGMMTGIFLAFIMDALDQTIRNPKFVTEQIGWVNLGSISRMSKEELALESDLTQKQYRRRHAKKRV